MHPGAELVERHGAEHRDPITGHPERHPERSLAALATDPRASSWEMARLSAMPHQSALANDAMGRAVKRAALLPFVGVHKPAHESPNSAVLFSRWSLPLFAEMLGRFC